MAGRAPNGLGTIIKRKDGRYQAAVHVLTADGSTKRKYVYGKTWDEANDKRVEMLENNRKGTPSISSGMKLGDYLDHWLTDIVKAERGPSTYSGYEIVVRRYIKKHLGTKRLNSLTTSHMRTFIRELRKEKTVLGKSLSDRYVQNIFETLRSALTYAIQEDLIGRNVAKMVQAPSRGEFEVEPLDEDGARRFTSHVLNHWLRAYWLILIMAGLRKGEALGLAWSDVNLATGAVTIRRTVQRVRGQLVFGPPKTPRSRRKLYVGRVIIAALLVHRTETADRLVAPPLNLAPGQPEDLIFITKTGRVVEPRNINTMLARLLKRARIPLTRVHDLRHTCATLLLMDGATLQEVMELLGHSTIGVTSNVYGHVLDATKKRIAHQMDQIIAPTDVGQ
ncbi:site-specific integrase [Actinokineospora inagensis]|uniref:site-specific integrase n=1 Tax=Actinokineospora inagensis TaxID=103730 RepID=UPI0004020389|nr:tyrosine-type recombinase/integrase [Actinokineospora inagensis]